MGYGRRAKTLKERFFQHAIVQDNCWGWQTKPNRHGYSTMKFDHKLYMAHRISLMIHGSEIPKDMVVDHICRNRKCTNPKHLRIVTRETNVLENSEGIAAKNRLKMFCKYGHPYDKENTSFSHRSTGYIGRECKACRRNSYLKRISKA